MCIKKKRKEKKKKKKKIGKVEWQRHEILPTSTKRAESVLLAWPLERHVRGGKGRRQASVHRAGIFLTGEEDVRCRTSFRKYNGSLQGFATSAFPRSSSCNGQIRLFLATPTVPFRLRVGGEPYNGQVDTPRFSPLSLTISLQFLSRSFQLVISWISDSSRFTVQHCI